jgi:hypothetical protein
MTIRRIAARPERNCQGLWIGVTCGMSVIAPAHELLSLAQAVAPAGTQSLDLKVKLRYRGDRYRDTSGVRFAGTRKI